MIALRSLFQVVEAMAAIGAKGQLVIPPSAMMTVPVMKVDIGEARNRAVFAISSGRAWRLSGICALNNSVALTPVMRVMSFTKKVWNSLSIGPGLREFTRI